ncbi:MAG: MBL fold metallo-hydrolase [Planctomycetota bacterium]
MSIEYRIISIGTLSSHPLRHEPAQRRTGHATTVLVSVNDQHMLINPSLPDVVLRARLDERTDLSAEDITDVFLTSFSVEHRRGLNLFEGARWYVHEPERVYALTVIADKQAEARDAQDDESYERFEHDRAMLQRCLDAPDSLAQGVDLFPLPGVTPGTCGVLLALARKTVLIAGDAVPTVEHLDRGQVLNTCVLIEEAQESFREAMEIADEIVLGRDNIVANPLREMQSMGRLTP